MWFTCANIKALSEGDIIRVRRLIYWHYGVVCGKEKIIHFTCYPNHIWEKSAEVKVTSIIDFVKSSKCIEVLDDPLLVNDRIRENAHKRIGEKGYLLFTNNCKHFVFSCMI